jgi:hypothetical protein
MIAATILRSKAKTSGLKSIRSCPPKRESSQRS